jgi:dienelactone hydrolase
MSPTARDIRVTTHGVTLEGNLDLPPNAQGIVLFAHGSGSSRHSPRNQFVAQVLQRSGLATLLLDLLTSDEEVIDEQTRHLRFDIQLLAERLVSAVDWLAKESTTRTLNIGCFGASTGAAAALIAAAERPLQVHAVVSRGGRPDLAGGALARVQAPTLFIVGGSDHVVEQLNREALSQLHAPHRLEIIPGATHLFEEKGALERVAALAADWFLRHLARA